MRWRLFAFYIYPSSKLFGTRYPWSGAFSSGVEGGVVWCCSCFGWNYEQVWQVCGAWGARQNKSKGFPLWNRVAKMRYGARGLHYNYTIPKDCFCFEISSRGTIPSQHVMPGSSFRFGLMVSKSFEFPQVLCRRNFFISICTGLTSSHLHLWE